MWIYEVFPPRRKGAKGRDQKIKVKSHQATSRTEPKAKPREDFGKGETAASKTKPKVTLT